MQSKFRPVLLAIVLLLIASLACSSLGTPPTSTPVPTNTPKPTNTPAPTATIPIVNVDGSVELDETVYNHPSGAFSFNSPKGWTIDDSGSYVVSIQSPEDVIFYVTVTNTGHALDRDSFDNYIAESEGLYYTYRDDYEQTNREVNEDINLVLIEKTYTKEGKTYSASSVYQQFGQVIYTFDMVGDNSLIQANPNYSYTFNAFLTSTNAYSDVAATLPVYEDRWVLYAASEKYQINVPTGWKYSVAEDNGLNFIEEDLLAPDNTAGIKVLTLDEKSGTPSISYLNEFTLLVLNSIYGKDDDVKIVDETEQDGDQLLEWTSPGSNSNGFALLATEPNTSEAWIVIIVWDKSFEDSYRQLALDLIKSFTEN